MPKEIITIKPLEPVDSKYTITTEKDLDRIHRRLKRYEEDTKVQRREHYEQLEKDWPRIKKEIDELLKDVPKTRKKRKGQKVKRK